MKSNYYSVKDAARLLGVKEATLRNYLSLGWINGVKVFGHTKVYASEIEKYLSKKRKYVKRTK